MRTKPTPPPLPPGVRRIIVKPSARGRGASWGLDQPLVFGKMEKLGGWAVWDRHTGVVDAFFPHVPNVHGWSPAEGQACAYSDPDNGTFNVFELDSVP